MNFYIGCKRVKAKLMTRGEFCEITNKMFAPLDNPNDEGYMVEYSDGCVSWSPKDVFKDAYREETSYPLVSTAILMNSKDYKERFIAEYKQLIIRYKALKAMLEKWDNNKLEFAPTCPRSTYNMQIKAMTDYIAVLEARAVMENINLQEE